MNFQSKKCGVYGIRCNANGKLYIGSTRTSFTERIYEHKRMLGLGSHANPKMQTAWNKYGDNSFEFYIIESCHPDLAYDREQFYMDTINPWFNHQRTARPCSKRAPHIGMRGYISSTINSIIDILIRCNELRSFCEWTKTQREFFGIPPATPRPQWVKDKISIGSIGKSSGRKGVARTPEHKLAQSIARKSYVSRMRSLGKWPPSFYLDKSTACFAT